MSYNLQKINIYFTSVLDISILTPLGTLSKNNF